VAKGAKKENPFEGIDAACETISKLAEFDGGSYGDEFIVERLAGRRGTGTASTWRAAGEARHIHVVLREFVPPSPPVLPAEEQFELLR
jgi:hypothetical protein